MSTHVSLGAGGTGAKVASKSWSLLSMYVPAAALMAAESWEYACVVSFVSDFLHPQDRWIQTDRVDHCKGFIDHHRCGPRIPVALAEALVPPARFSSSTMTNWIDPSTINLFTSMESVHDGH